MGHVAFGVLEEGDVVRCLRLDGASLIGPIVGMYSNTRGVVERLAIIPTSFVQPGWRTMEVSGGRMACVVDLGSLESLSRRFGLDWRAIEIQQGEPSR